MNKSVTTPVPASVLEALARYDTPTICNAMEIVAPERRLIGYTTKPLVCPFPDLPPMVGYARTVTIRSVVQSGLPAAEQFPHHAFHEIALGGARCELLADDDAQPGLLLAVGAHVQHEMRTATPGPQSKNG